MAGVINDIKNGADEIDATGALFIALTGIVVGLRIISRPLLKIKLGTEDCLLLAATTFYWIQLALNFVCKSSAASLAERRGFLPSCTAVAKARAATSPLDPNSAKSAKFLYYSGCFYYPTSFCVHLSIIFLYQRLFITPEFRRISLVVIALNLCWFIAGWICQILMCVPVRALWDFRVKGTCYAYSVFYLAIAVIETLLDVIIFVLPLHEVSKLQLNPRKKLLISLVFALGGFSIITGALRAALSYEGPGRLDINLAQDAIWVNVHLGTAIICACLPTLRPLFSWGASKFSSTPHKYGYASSKSDGSRNSKKEAPSAESSSERWNGAGYNGNEVHLTEVSAWPANAEYYKSEGVQVKQTVEIIV